MSTITLPASLTIRNLLEDLLGREVTVSAANPPEVDDLRGVFGAIYADGAMKMVAVAGLELPLAAYCGAALGLMPAGAAQDFNHEGGPHIKLYKVYPPPEPLPSDAQASLLALGNRLDLTVEVARYGKGRLSLALAW